MSKLVKLIGEGRAIFASVLCLLSLGFLAPNVLAAAGTTCERMVLENGQSTNLVKGVYTAVATNVPGGAVYVNAGGKLTGEDVTFAGNETKDEGGAIWSKGKLTFSGESCFSNNVATKDGGAISTGGEVTFTGAATFECNSGLYGGAIANSGMLTFASSAMFADNKAAGNYNAGGAIENFGGEITFAEVAFFGNSANDGGAIYNEDNGYDGKIGVITFAKGATFSNNTATAGNGVAIYNSSTVNFNGDVTLVTTNDTIYNSGLLNWNLTGETTGCLNGYDKLTNDVGTLQLTVKDYNGPREFVIATGDFSDVSGKDTFLITNVTSGVAKTIKIGGITRLDGIWWKLVIEGNQLICRAPKLAKLSNVSVIDEKTGVTNATAVAVVAGIPFDRCEPSFMIPDDASLAGTWVSLEYTVTDPENYMIGPGWTTKTVKLRLKGDTDMNDTGLKPVVEPLWADVREIAIDTRARIVIGDPNDVLPIAYSTNNWGAVKSDQTSLYINDSPLVDSATTNGYANWMPKGGAYDPYEVCQKWQGSEQSSTNVTIYYSQPYQLKQAVDGSGTFNLSAYTFKEGEVLGYDLVDIVAKPAEGSVFAGWTLFTNGVEVVDAFEDAKALTNRFEMPCTDTKILARFGKLTGCTVNGKDIAYGSGEGWEYTPATDVKLGTLQILGDEVESIVLSGKLPSHTKVTSKASQTPSLTELVLENFTNDVSDCNAKVALTVPAFKNKSGTIKLIGANYLAAGAGTSAIDVTLQTATFMGEGLLTAIPGTAKTVLPAVKCTMGKCVIGQGTYNNAVDPALVTTSEKVAAFSNGDGTWTVKPYVVVTFETIPSVVYTVVTNAKNECVAKPANPAHPTAKTLAFNYWSISGQSNPWDFSTPVAADMVLLANYASMKAAYVNEKGVTNTATSVGAAITNAPAGGTVTTKNPVEVTDVDKPVVIVGSKKNGVNVEPLSGLVVAYSTNEVDGTVMAVVGTNVANVVVVEKPLTQPEVPVVEKPEETDQGAWEKVTNAVATARTPDVKEIVDASALEAAAKIAKKADVDAIVTEVKLLVEPTAVETNKTKQVADFMVDIRPVLTVYGIKGGAMTNILAASTNDFALSGKPVTVTLSLEALGQTPKLIEHKLANGDVEYFYHPDEVKAGEKSFSYDSVAKTVSLEMTSFSPVAVYFEVDQLIPVTLDAGEDGYFGDPKFTTRIVYESRTGTGKYRNLVDPTPLTSSSFGGWYYGTTNVVNGADFVKNAAHKLVAKWIVPIPPVETNEYTVTFNVQGHGKAPLPQIVKEGECAKKPADPVEEGWEFGGWFKDKVCSNAYDFATKVTKDLTLYAKWTEEPQPVPEVETSVTFIESDYEVTEGDTVEVEVFGGSSERSTSVTLSFVKGTYTSVPTVYVDGEKAKFPLTLDWAKGEVCTQTVEIVTRKYSKVEADKFFTLQLSAPAGIELGAKPVATVTVLDKVQPSPEGADYVRALAWPANGGTVSGSGTLKNEKSKLTLKASAKSYATFAGWYLPMTNDVNQIDTNALVTLERSLKVGYGTEYGEGTYYAYFTDVLPVAAVVDPDASSEEAEGVVEEDGVYSFQVGIYAQLPLDIEDESGKGTLSVASLPMGLKYDKKTGFIYGTPVKECVKEVKIIAKNAAGKQTVYYTFVVEAMPSEAIGTWNGLVRSLANTNDLSCAGIGSVQFSASSSGKLSAKVTTRLAGMKSFSTTGYELIDENTLGVTMTTRAGEVFEAKLILTNGWTEAQLFGKVTGGAFEKNDEECRFMAIKNAFDKKTGEAEAIALLKLFKGTYEDTVYLAKGGDEVGAITFKVQDGGKVQVKAKSENGVYSANCAGAFRIVTIGDEEVAMVQGAIRSGRRLLTFSTTIKADSDDIKGFACDYDTKGDDTHETIGVPTNTELID